MCWLLGLMLAYGPSDAAAGAVMNQNQMVDAAAGALRNQNQTYDPEDAADLAAMNQNQIWRLAPRSEIAWRTWGCPTLTEEQVQEPSAEYHEKDFATSPEEFPTGSSTAYQRKDFLTPPAVLGS